MTTQKSPDTISVSENAAKSKAFLEGAIYNPFKLFHNILIPDALVRYPGLSPSAKLCFGRLARYAGQNGVCYPSVSTLAKELALCERQVVRCLGQLEKQRFIRRVARGGRSNFFQFLWHPLLAASLQHQAAADLRHTPPDPPDRNVTPPPTFLSPKESDVSGSGESECAAAASPHPLPPEPPQAPAPEPQPENPPVERQKAAGPWRAGAPPAAPALRPASSIPLDLRGIAEALEGKALKGDPDRFICRRILNAAQGDEALACFFIHQKFQTIREGNGPLPDRFGYYETVVREETAKFVYRQIRAAEGASPRKLDMCGRCGHSNNRCLCYRAVAAGIAKQMPAAAPPPIDEAQIQRDREKWLASLPEDDRNWILDHEAKERAEWEADQETMRRSLEAGWDRYAGF